MRHPSFSIVVATFQRREVVCDAIRHIAAIDYPGEVELIVVIDGSTDGTAEAIAEIECPLPMTIIWQENGGAAAARNKGAAEAEGDIILFLDDDMMCEPDILVHHSATHASVADAVLGDIPLDLQSRQGFLSAGVGKWAAERATVLATKAKVPVDELISGHLSVRRTLFEKLGGFDVTFTRGGAYGNEDLDFGTRLQAESVIRFEPKAIARHRYVNGPRDILRQRFEAGRADVTFARKHPRHATNLFALRGAYTLSARWVLRPLAAVPAAAWLICESLTRLAERFETAHGAVGRIVGRSFDRALRLAWWSGVRSAGGIPNADRALVLCYHAMTDLSNDPLLAEYGLPPERFAEQLDQLRARGHSFVTPEQVAAFLEIGAPLPRKAVLLTFDDCYTELPAVAREILAPRGIGALAFAVTGLTGATNEWDQDKGAARLALLDVAGLKELQEAGVEIGAHSRSHLKLPQLAPDMIVSETAGAADDLVAMGLPRPRFFAYPHGQCDARSKAALRDAGYLAGFGLTRSRVLRSSDHFDLPRVEIRRSDNSLRFGIKTTLPRLSVIFEWRDLWAELSPSVKVRIRRLAGLTS